jgi:hypothetical protein
MSMTSKRVQSSKTLAPTRPGPLCLHATGVLTRMLLCARYAFVAVNQYLRACAKLLLLPSCRTVIMGLFGVQLIVPFDATALGSHICHFLLSPSQLRCPIIW